MTLATPDPGPPDMYIVTWQNHVLGWALGLYAE